MALSPSPRRAHGAGSLWERKRRAKQSWRENQTPLWHRADCCCCRQRCWGPCGLQRGGDGSARLQTASNGSDGPLQQDRSCTKGLS
eukprot:3937484-Rhodomonas_salina.1